jgi:PAS domain S-box-containing protein
MVLFDARETLDKFMRAGRPDANLFATHVGGIIDGRIHARPESRIRAYGEMVDLLWRDGNKDGAIELEELWNELGRSRPFSLLCAYVMDDFHTKSDGEPFLRVCRAHGHVFPTERYVAIEDENARLREISMLQQSARALQSEERFRLFVESVKDYAIFMLDPKGHVASWNVGAERIKGYTESEIIGRHFSTFYPRQDVEAGKCEQELQAATRDGRFEDEGWRIRKDGSAFWANVVITAIHDARGQLVAFGKVTRDLTERRNAERERIRRARAEEGERRREEFLAILGHELRNPLASMSMAVNLLKGRHDTSSDKEIGILDRQLSQMVRLLDDAANVSRALQDKVRLELKCVDIRDVVANAVEASNPLIRQKRHLLEVDVPETSLLVEIDPERMTQVFTNLLNNACKYTDEGGKIRVSAVGHADEVHVVFADTGIGIAPEFKEHVFELFRQAEGGLQRQLGGLGVGLAVARQLVDAHQGTITAESEGVGRGSRFTVRLPRSKLAKP